MEDKILSLQIMVLRDETMKEKEISSTLIR